MSNKIPVGILGATGSVGQKFIELLLNHPWFEINELGASERSAGKKYCEATQWNMPVMLPESIASIKIKNCIPNFNSKVIFSALDSSVAGEIETDFAKKGYFIISNARNHRMECDVPLVIPEVNHEHLAMVKKQNWDGAIITNPNCSTIGLAMALKPLHAKFGIKAVNVVTMQAISGGGYPGIPSMDMLDNVVPFISGEEAKMESEPLKLLGSLENNKFKNADFVISAQCNRVNVLDGHTECVQINLEKQTTEKEIIITLQEFTSLPQELNLPSAPAHPIIYMNEERHPQPRIHRNLENGMAVSVGRLRKDTLFDYKFVVLSHNTVRGAAGGTILIAELLKAQNYFE